MPHLDEFKYLGILVIFKFRIYRVKKAIGPDKDVCASKIAFIS